jgi:hypothetical protein
MALFPLGILSAAGAGGVVAEDYELIETQILGSSQASVTFSSLGTYSSTYKHLQIRATVRDSFTGADTARLGMRFNGDSSANMVAHGLFSRGSSVVSFGVTGDTAIRIVQDTPTASFVTANTFAGVVIDILDPFSTTKFKTVRSMAGFSANHNFIGLGSGLWRDTSSTTSLTLLSVSGTLLLTGSRFSLYGIKG